VETSNPSRLETCKRCAAVVKVILYAEDKTTDWWPKELMMNNWS
jgi:hypothetical protein